MAISQWLTAGPVRNSRCSRQQQWLRNALVATVTAVPESQVAEHAIPVGRRRYASEHTPDRRPRAAGHPSRATTSGRLQVVSAYGCYLPVKVCPDGPLTNCCNLRAEVLPWMGTTLETIDILLRLAKAPVARDRKPLGAVQEAGATRFPLGRVGGGSGSDRLRNPSLRAIASRQRHTSGPRLRRDRDGTKGPCDDRVIPDFLGKQRLTTSRFRDGHRSRCNSLRPQEPRCGRPEFEVHHCHPRSPRPRLRNRIIP